MKYEDKILRMNIVEMCAKDRSRYDPLQEEIRSWDRQTLSYTNYSTSLDWNAVLGN